LPDRHLLVIGARGFVGEHVSRAAEDDFHLFRGSRSVAENARDVYIDVTDRESIAAAFEHTRPEVVVLLAALSDIDRCEREPDVAERVNVEGAQNVARACAHIGARLVYVSSSAVFDGAEHGYTEDHPVTPVSVYGRTKARAEELVTSEPGSAVVVRVSLVLGFAAGCGTNSQLNRVAEEWGAGRAVSFPTFESRNAIDARTFSRWLLELARNPNATGIYHAGAADSLSRYEIGLLLADRMGVPSHLVLPQHTLPAGRAPRGRDHFLLTDKLRNVCLTPVPNLRQVIERCFNGTP